MLDLSSPPVGNLAAMLTSFVSRVQEQNEIIRGANAEKVDIFREARECGINAKALKETIRRLKQDAEQAVIVDEYLRSLGVDPGKLRAQGLEPSKVVGGFDGFPSDLPDNLSESI